MPVIGFIHSTRFVIEPVDSSVSAECPEAEIIHIMDQGLLRALRQDGRMRPRIIDQLTGILKSVQIMGGDIAIVTCSSLSPCVDIIRKKVKIPVLKIDEPMVEYAVRWAEKIGVIMTNPSTQKPSMALINEVSQRMQKPVRITTRVCNDAFSKLNSGDIQGHDEAVVNAIQELLPDVDLVMLAQISTARIMAQLDEITAQSVLSSLNFIAPKIREKLGEVNIRRLSRQP